MIQIQLLDSNKNELTLDDIVLVHYPNPNVKLLAILKFNITHKQFIHEYKTDDYWTWTGLKNDKIERIGSSFDYPELIPHCARYENKKDVKSILEIIDKALGNI